MPARLVRSALCCVLWVLWSFETGPFGISGAAAQDALPIDAFVGEWRGTGVAEDEDNLFFSMTLRDLDVTIRPTETGFTVHWTSLIRGGSPDDPDVRRKGAALTLERAKAPGVYRAIDSADPLQGGVMSWARVTGRTLSVYQMALNAEGGYELTSYERTLDDKGMALTFTRIRDTVVVRTVKGRLAKTAD